MTAIQIKNKELKIKDPNFLIEDEVAPEAIQFIINDANDITEIEDLTWLVQYHRSANDNGFDLIAPDNVRIENGIVYLTWYPSGGATLNKGKTQIQVVGIKVDTETELPIVRWATAPSVITLPENIQVTQLSPILTPEYITALIAQLNLIKDQTEEFRNQAEGFKIESVREIRSEEDEGLNEVIFIYKNGSESDPIYIKNGSKGQDATNVIDDTTTSTETTWSSSKINVDKANSSALSNEILQRQSSDTNLQNQIDAIVSKSDVVDVVGTYQELLAYDTSKLGDNDVVKVLVDSTHQDSRSYYRWKVSTTSWMYIGSESVGYTKAEADVKFVEREEGKGLIQLTKITSYDSHVADSTIHVTSQDKSNWNGKAEPSDIPTTIAELEQDSTHRVVTDTEKSTWNAKQDSIADLENIRSGAGRGQTAYQKPTSGIPKTDLTSDVQNSLGKADSSLQASDLTPYRKSADQDEIDEALQDDIDNIGNAYLKNATLSQDEKTLTLTKQDGSTVDFQGGNDVNLSVVNGKLCITYTE